jgi:hypothetical protein
MKNIIVFLCLLVIGCTTTPKVNKITPPIEEKPISSEKRASIDQKELDSIITVFSETIKNNPKYAGAYYNRGIAYFYKSEYDKCWQDVHKAESLGYKFKDEFIKALREASGRQE